MNEIMKIVIDIKNNNKEIEYYGKYSLNNLMIFVAGYTYKLWNKGVKNLEFFPGLDEFVLKYYDLDKNDKIFQNKIDIISFFSRVNVNKKINKNGKILINNYGNVNLIKMVIETI